MLIIAVYDISDNVKREKMARLLNRMGLRRIQRSAFIGNITYSRAKDIARASKNLIDPENDILHLIPVNRIESKKIIVVGTPKWGAGAPDDTVIIQ